MNGNQELKNLCVVQDVKDMIMMKLQKTIQTKIVAPTNIKREKLEKEYSNFQDFLQLQDVDFLPLYKNMKLYSATKQQAERLAKRTKPKKEQPLIIRKDCIKVKKTDNKLSKYWVKVPVYNKSIWVAINFSNKQQHLLDYDLSESKLIKGKKGWFLNITVQKEQELKTNYADTLSIDLGVKNIASVVQHSNKKTNFYGKDIRETRGHYFHLKKKLARKKIRGFYKKIKNNKEKRITKDQLHKTAKDIVDWAKNTNSAIVVGDLKGIRKNGARKKNNKNYKGKKFNRKLNSMPSYQLSQFIEYKANWEGISVIKVKESYTSQLCWRCGNEGIRKTQGLFWCPECKEEENADRNGSINICKRGLGYMSKSGAVLAQPRTEAEFIKKSASFCGSECDLRISRF